MLAFRLPSTTALPQIDPLVADMTTASGMSVAVLHPSPAVYGQASMFATNAAPSKRPKLSLNTNTTSTSPFRSKQSTSLRLDTLSATSPTTRNTYGNAYPSSTGHRRPATPLRKDSAQADTPIDKAILLPLASPTSATCDVESRAEIIPYTLDNDVNPILRNGPRERPPFSRRSSSQSKPIFTLTKRVIFRAPLTEEVQNKQYTLRHSDIAHPAASQTIADVVEENAEVTLVVRPSESSVSGHETETSSCSATPVAGRNKKDRHWYWTLGSDRMKGVGAGEDNEASPTQVDADDTTDD